MIIFHAISISISSGDNSCIMTRLGSSFNGAIGDLSYCKVIIQPELGGANK